MYFRQIPTAIFNHKYQLSTLDEKEINDPLLHLYILSVIITNLHEKLMCLVLLNIKLYS